MTAPNAGATTAQDLYDYLCSLREGLTHLAVHLKELALRDGDEVGACGDTLLALLDEMNYEVLGEPSGRAAVCILCGEHYPLSAKRYHEQHCSRLIATGHVRPVIGGPDSTGFREGM